MASNPTPSWFLLAADGQKVGPFSVEDLQRLLQAGKIHPQNRAIAVNAAAGQIVTVSEALHVAARAATDPARLPPRPDSDVTNPAIQLQVRPDPALDLLDVLQSVRERQAQAPARAAGSAAGDYSGNSVRGAPSPEGPNFALIGGLVALAVVGAWGASQLVGGSSSSSSSNSTPTHEPRAIVAKANEAPAPSAAPSSTAPVKTANAIAAPKPVVRPTTTLFRPAAVAPVQTRAQGALDRGSSPSSSSSSSGISEAARERDAERDARDREYERERERELRGDSRDRDPRDRDPRERRSADPRDRDPNDAGGDWATRNSEGVRHNAVSGAVDIAPAPAPAGPPRGGGAEREGDAPAQAQGFSRSESR